MAEYLPYIQEVMPEPFLYRPDFGFINQMLQRKQAQFEQGLGQVRNSYQSVLNAPLSNVNNIPIRDQYARAAQEQLKKLSGVDLSLPQNVAAAESIFSPFWEDKFILKDYSYTNWYQGQQQKLANWRDSNDPKVRAMYSPIMQQDLNNGLMKLQRADRTDEGFSKLERREAIPFVNVEQYLQEMAKSNSDGEGGLKVVFDEKSPDGAYLVRTSNGERSQKRFATWAEGMLGTNLDEQFRITGRVQAENFENDFRYNPIYAGRYTNSTDEEIRTLTADRVVNNLASGYEKRLGNLNSTISEIDSLLNAFPATINDPQQAASAQALLRQREELVGLKTKVESEYEGFNKEDNKSRLSLIEAVKNNPNAYFGTLAKQAIINNWSVARAEVEGREIKVNESFFKAENLALDKRKQELEEQKQVDLQNFRAAMLSAKGTKGTKGNVKLSMDENGNPIIGFENMEGQDAATGAKFMGLGTTDITKSADAAQVFDANQLTLISAANDRLFGQGGAVGVLKNLGLSPDEVMQISSGLQRQLEQGDDFSWNADEAKALAKLSTNEKFAKYYKDSKVTSLKESILAYSKDYFDQKKNNNIEFTKDDIRVFNNYRAATTLSDQFLANERNREQMVKDHVLSNPKLYETKDASVIVTRDGKRDLIKPEDLEELLPKGVDWGITVNGKKLTNNDIARLYLAGRLDVPRGGGGQYRSDRGDIIIDGESYLQPKDNQVSGPFGALRSSYTNKLNEIIYNEFEKKFGKPKALSQLYSKAVNAVVPNLQYFQNKVAQLGTVWGLDLDDKKNDPQSFAIFQEALLPGNQLNIYGVDAEGNREVVESSTRDALKKLLASRENQSKYVGAYTYHTQGANGNPYIEFSIQELSSKDANTIGDDVSIKDLNKVSYQIELSPGTKAPNINNLPRNSGNYIYEQLLQGKTVVSDDFLKPFGVSYQVVPDNNRNPTGGTVYINYELATIVKDPTTGVPTYKRVPQVYEEPFSFVDDARKTPDEVMQMIEEKISQLMIVNQDVKTQYDKYLTTTNAPGFDLGSIRRTIGIQK